ncbi:hypothetical protein J2755_001980 [Methanohalophilus levihalophilus]|uniref:hypothetical protein n=1 Tax=Methanohalophilus levihalophilus TaxID=1431282 RepID=UPI001AE62133|nr:hypothetical protein [Methanohalophilus levihalophilus]MBP2031032.1 hypothetical protein [Methanohalophilus levihalophilus]
MKKFDDSGQMLLLAAFAIAFMVVVSTIMLNNLIFASNVASESGDELSSFEISNIVQLTDEATKAAYYNATNGGPFDDASFSNYMNTYQQEMATAYAYQGILFHFDNSTLNDAYFTKNGLESGTEDWILINNVEEVANFTIEIPDPGNLGNTSNQFEIHAINQSGSSIWYMKIHNDTTNVNVTTIDYDVSYPLAYTTIDIIGNPNFKFATRTFNQTYRIEYINGSSIVGLYSITGNLTGNETFESERYKVINTTISIASGKNKINVSVPVTIP